jgi:hypothetical protein
MKEIIIGHLLPHQGGWSNCVVGDYCSKPLTVAASLDIAGSGSDDFVLLLFRTTLQFDPGHCLL